MRLAVVTNILAPYRIPLFEAIKRRVEDFTVLLMADREENRDWNIQSYDFKAEVLQGIHFRPPGYEISLHFNHGVIRTLRRLDPDIVMSGGFAPANIAAACYCKWVRKPFVAFGELVLRDPFHRSPMRRALRRWVTRASAGAIASSSEARAAFLAYGAKPDRILIAPMPIDVERFRAGAESFRESPEWASARRRYPGPVLLAVTRLIRMKGVDELLSIYEQIIAVWPDATLLLAGDGPERSRYEALVRERGLQRVEFLGYIDTAALPRTYALADLLVFPTLYDQFGAVIAEAMAAGVPVAASIHAAATHDLVDDGVTGFRIEPRATEASAATILRMLALDGRDQSAMKASALARVREFAIEPSAERMTEFLRSIARVPAGAVRA